MTARAGGGIGMQGGDPWPGDRQGGAGRGARVTSRDVARLAGVSQPTVSRALRNHPLVPETTRARIREAAKALGYVPSQLGRSLSTQATHQVAMVADLDNPLYPILLGPVHDQLAESGYGTLLLAERSGEIEGHEALWDRSVDGVILSAESLRSLLPLELDRRGIPFVFLNRTHDLIDHDSATADDAGGGEQVARLLAGLGHRRIGVLLGPETTSTSRNREQGFRAALAEEGIAVPDKWVARSTYTEASGSEAFRQVMAGDDRPTAVFCINDNVAVGALNAARELGLSAPADVTIVGFDDLAIAAWPVFNLTTVANPLPATARRAAQLLIERLAAGPSAPYRHEVAPTSLVLRGTHGAPPSSDQSRRRRMDRLSKG